MSEVAQRTPPGVLVPVPGLARTHSGPRPRSAAGAGEPQGLQLQHLRYLVLLAGAGTFHRVAERLFMAQPTLSQQIRQLEEIVGTSLLRRRRDGLQLTAAGRVLLDASRTALARVDQAVSCTRQAAGVGRPRLRVVLPLRPPESLAVAAAARLQKAAAASLPHYPLTASAALVWHGDLAPGTGSPAKVYSGCPKETLPSGGPDAASWSLALALAAGIVNFIGCQSRMKAEWTLAG